MASMPALDLTTSLRGDFTANLKRKVSHTKLTDLEIPPLYIADQCCVVQKSSGSAPTSCIVPQTVHACPRVENQQDSHRQFGPATAVTARGCARIL